MNLSMPMLSIPDNETGNGLIRPLLVNGLRPWLTWDYENLNGIGPWVKLPHLEQAEGPHKEM